MNRKGRLSHLKTAPLSFLTLALLLTVVSCAGTKSSAPTVVDFEVTPLAGSQSTTLSAVQRDMPALVILWTST